ncbi:MAG: carbamoyltransferase [Betaproteobacteria bacterium]|nr:carbamoyltransferase [Betaproteobacteria bacterium]
MNILGIKCSGHDTGAALITDRSGRLEISAISEARLNRRKHSYTYPLLSIQYVMARFGIESLEELDLICIDKHGELWPQRGSQFGRLAAKNRRTNEYDFDARFNYLIEQSIRFPKERVKYVNHVDAHAASCYHVSGFSEAAILTLEGGTGFYIGKGTDIQVIDRTGYGGDEYRDGKITHGTEVSWPRHYWNTSNLYDLITRKLGLDKFAAGKTMALAAFRDRFTVHDYLQIPKDRHQGFFTDYRQLILRLGREVRDFIPTSKATRDTELLEQYWVNIAREAQDALEQDVLYMAGLAGKKSGLRNLCLAGGVALSCVTNRKILDLGIFDNVYVQPAASDEGIPLGCALWGYYDIKGGTSVTKMEHAYLGTPYNASDVPAILSKWGLQGRRVAPKEIARMLSEGKIFGRIAGGSEYGPRALGNRSILADPRIPNMLEIVNTQIKHRERFRPFAPSCQADKQDRYFDLPCPSPFMLMACSVTEEAKPQIPAVIHVDGSSRVQSVTPAQNSAYYELIGEFGQITGVYTLLNTSFNDDGEPIVENFEDALLSFVRTGLHCLYIEDHLVERPSQAQCEKLKAELAPAIKSRVERSYSAAVAAFCDPARFDQFSRELEKSTLSDLFLSLSQYVRKAKSMHLHEQVPGALGRGIRITINRVGEVARHSHSAAAMYAATASMLCVDLVWRFKKALRV